jgi:hypothetical protein
MDLSGMKNHPAFALGPEGGMPHKIVAFRTGEQVKGEQAKIRIVFFLLL